MIPNIVPNIVLGQNDSQHTSYNGKWSQNKHFWPRMCLKLPRGKKSFFWVLANHPVVHSGGVSRGRVRGCI